MYIRVFYILKDTKYESSRVTILHAICKVYGICFKYQPRFSIFSGLQKSVKVSIFLTCLVNLRKTQ